MTLKTRGQRKIEYESDIQKSKEKIFEYFKKSDFIDCKINAFLSIQSILQLTFK